MVDILTRKQRSALMGRIRGKDTKPELAVRRAAHMLGYRFRLHRRDLPGTPDLVFPSRGKVVFVHGCFWHGHPGCRYATVPSTRTDFWKAKIARNRERDAATIAALKKAGWGSLVVWQCETERSEKLRRSLVAFLGPRPARTR